MSKRKLITSALPYVNNIPHLGNLVGCVLSADVYARWCRIQGDQVLYVCGADEYGTCTEVKAIQECVSPKQLCDKYNKIHQEIYKWFNISFDHWGRTSTDDPKHDSWSHTTIAQDIFRRVVDNGFAIEQETEQLFCSKLDMFVADRYVIGTCPKCKMDGAKGDQCDGCGTLYNASELIDPKYAFNPSYNLEMRTTTNLYLDLPKLEPEIRRWVDSVKHGWSDNAIQITESWLKDGLKPRCITRNLKWGTPVPDTDTFGDKYRNHIMYNWFDAPIGYISITDQSGQDWREWWQNSDVELVNFFGKDNCVFHSIIFPATLIACGDNYELVKKISSVNYLQYNGGKFSKSNNIGVFGDGAIDSGIPADIWRYYLIYQRPEKNDTEFSWIDFQSKINGELNDNVGNLINRILNFTHKRFNSIPERGTLEQLDTDFIDEITKLENEYQKLMDNIELKRGLITVLSICHATNKYINVAEPWKIIKTDETRCRTVLSILCHIAGLISKLLEPFMPETSNKINEYLDYKYTDVGVVLDTYIGTKLNKPSPLFSKVTPEQIDKLETRFG